jgi:ABC-type nitrate/sulfonate/bicarbonate transport system ATPase subunit
MDEPFNGLDIQTREDLQAMTIELWREVGSTVVLVSHDLDEAIRMGDRLLVLSHCGDGFIMDEINHIERPRPRRSIDIQQNSEFRRLWMQVQSVIS